MVEVACAIIIRDSQILCVQRSSLMALPLKWEFPGGKIESNESAAECIVREILEELGLNITVTKPLTPNVHNYGEEKVIKLIPFICKIVDGQINLIEHQSYLWLSANELKSLDWAEADIPIVEEYLKFNL